MNAKIFLKRRPSAKRRAFPCPNCGSSIASRDAASIAFIASVHGTSTDFCLRCTLDEVELVESALYIDLPVGGVDCNSDRALKRTARKAPTRKRIQAPKPSLTPLPTPLPDLP